MTLSKSASESAPGETPNKGFKGILQNTSVESIYPKLFGDPLFSVNRLIFCFNKLYVLKDIGAQLL